MYDKNDTVYLSVIIPVYNEESSIANVLDTLSEELSKFDFPTEIVIVDDGSKDKTASIISEYATKLNNLKFIKHSRNKGKGAAVKTGISEVIGNYFIIQDADMEYHPKDIRSLIEPIISQEVQVVFGSRFSKMKKPEGMRFSHYLGNLFLSLLTTILFFTIIRDMETGYKCLSKKLFVELDIKSDGFDLEPELTSKILKRKIKILEVPINFSIRKTGEAKISWLDGVKAACVIIKIKFSRK